MMGADGVHASQSSVYRTPRRQGILQLADVGIDAVLERRPAQQRFGFVDRCGQGGEGIPCGGAGPTRARRARSWWRSLRPERSAIPTGRRSRCEMTQVEIARRLEVPQTTISEWRWGACASRSSPSSRTR